jgi:hypothetical protein
VLTKHTISQVGTDVKEKDGGKEKKVFSGKVNYSLDSHAKA